MFNEIQEKRRIRLFSLSLPMRIVCSMFLRVNVGYNTSTVALRVVEGDERRTLRLRI
jgi:hypothetical protein